MTRTRTAFLFALVAGALFLLQGTSESKAPAVDYTIDAVHSSVLFRIRHAGISNTYGRFNKFSGEFAFTPDGQGSSVSVAIDPASVDTNSQKRDDHLRSPDFLSVKEFPTISFRSTSWRRSDDDEFEVTGDLTLHGVTKEVTLEVEKVGEGDFMDSHRIGFEGEIDIKRSDFGMTKMAGAVGDEVQIMIAVEGIRK